MGNSQSVTWFLLFLRYVWCCTLMTQFLFLNSWKKSWNLQTRQRKVQKTTIQSGKHSAKSGVLKLQHGLYCLKVNFFFWSCLILFFSQNIQSQNEEVSELFYISLHNMRCMLAVYRGFINDLLINLMIWSLEKGIINSGKSLEFQIQKVLCTLFSKVKLLSCENFYYNVWFLWLLVLLYVFTL